MTTRPSHTRSMTAFALAAAAALALGASPAEAQWSVEGRLGATLPTGDLTDASLNQTGGLAVSGDLMYTFRPNVTFYGGVGHHRFNCDDCATDLTSTGLDAGLKYLFGPSDGAMPWIRAGLLVHKPEVEGGDGEWGFGLDSGIGIDWSVSEQLTLVPALRYDTYEAEEVTFSWFTIDLGAHLHLGG